VLGELVRVSPPANPFDPVRVVVGSRGMARWPRYGADDGVTTPRQWGIARQIANVFDRYITYRPELARAWSAGKRTDLPLDDLAWQPILWDMLAKRLNRSHRADRAGRPIDALQHGARPTLTAPVRVFGLSSLPCSPRGARTKAATPGDRPAHPASRSRSPTCEDRKHQAPPKSTCQPRRNPSPESEEAYRFTMSAVAASTSMTLTAARKRRSSTRAERRSPMRMPTGLAGTSSAERVSDSALAEDDPDRRDGAAEGLLRQSLPASGIHQQRSAAGVDALHHTRP
jgi:hypothetical protein